MVKAYLHKNKEYETYVDDSSCPIKFQIFKKADRKPCGSVEELCTREVWNDAKTNNGTIGQQDFIELVESEFNKRISN